MCTQFNLKHSFATATPFDLNEDGDDDASDLVIAIRKQVSIDAGVSKDFLGATLRLWGGMLLSSQDFFEGPTVESADGDE